MRRYLLVTTAVLALGGTAAAQTSTAPGQQPPGQAGSAAQPGAAPSATGQPSAGQPSAAGAEGTSAQSRGDAAPQTGLRRVDPAGNVRLTFYTVQAADMRASELMGAEVYNLDNESIGEVEDLIIDGGKTIKGVVVSVGGFLGIGERNVALDPRSVVLSEQDDGSARLVVNTTRDDLKKAPPFDFAEVDKSGGRAQTTGSSRSGAALQPNGGEARGDDGSADGNPSR